MRARSRRAAIASTLTAAVLALAVVVLAPAPAAAHAVLVKSVPARRATLARAPDRVQLWFNERLEPAFSSVSLWDAANRRVETPDGAVSAEDPRRLELPLAALAPGRYLIRFRVLSVDGHVVESSIPFTVKPDASR